ncbi:MAG: DMT family transporter [Clostridiales bacterium]|nr:DMT family transporter [Clostridiales bacterium]
MKVTKERQSMGLMALCACLWSIAGIFIKWISWNPLLIAGFRSIVSAVVLGIFMAATGRKLKFNKWTFMAGAGLSCSCICFVMANKLTTAANAIVLQYMAPVFILIISALFLKKKLNRTDVTVVAVTVIGIALFFFDQLSPGSIVGNLLGILAGIFLAVMFVAVGQARDDDSVRMTGILLAHVITSVAGCVTLAFVPFEPTGTEIIYAIILGVFQLGIPYVLYTVASKYCPPLACSLIGMLEPLLNPVWVFIFDGEAPGTFALIGAAIIIVTIGWWCVWESKKKIPGNRV